MNVIQVVGYTNSGKTTTVAALIQYFSKTGVSVASFKHHGHGGYPEGLDTKDSMVHQEAGAVISGVEGAGLLQFVQKQSWNLERIIQIYHLFQVGLLLIEGYKIEDYRKIVLIPVEADVSLLDEVSNIIAVVSDLPLHHLDFNVPVFKRNELTDLCKWMREEQIGYQK